MKTCYTLLFPLCFLAAIVQAQTPLQSCVYHWCTGEPLQDVQFDLQSSAAGIPPISLFLSSNGSGCVVFSNAVPLAAQIKLTPYKDPTHCNFSTSNLQASYERIQRHINGTEPFTEIWQWLAADVNADSIISDADITTMQQWVAGSGIQPFPNGCMRFVPKSYIFPNPLTPLIPTPPVFLSGTVLLTFPANKDFWGIELGNLVQNTVCVSTGVTSPTTLTASAASPNPTTGSFFVQIQLAQATELRTEVFDLTGKRISAQSSQTYPSGISTLSFAPIAGTGVFIWKITGADGQYQVGKIARE